jgi:non-ribosomal peptide synthetase component F
MAVSHDTYQKLQALASRTNCTLQSLLMTLAAVTTYVVTGKENFAIFSLTHGRLNQYLKNTVGCMMNTVNVFFDLKPDTTIEKLLPECYLTFLDTLSHGRLPMGEQIPMTYIEAVKHFFNFNPGWLLFSSMEYGDLFAHSAYEMSMIHQTNQAHQFYLSMQDVAGEQVNFELSYQTRRFKPETIRQILKDYYYVINCATDHPQWSIGQIRSEFKKGDKR